MKKKYLIATLFIICISSSGQQNPFTSNKLRIDITIFGTSNSTSIKITDHFKEPQYSNSPQHFIDTFLYGQYLYELVDYSSNKIIFSNGFCSLFNEWQLTPEAQKKSFSVGKTLIMPFPQNKSVLKIYSNNLNKKTLLLTDSIDPTTIKSKAYRPLLKPKKIIYNGNPTQKLDILILGDGYSKVDQADFFRCAKTFIDSILIVTPFKENRQSINFWAICPPSEKSGITYNTKSSALGCEYNTIGSDRYLYTTENSTVANIASQTPYDQIIILVNSSKYGGGGIYNDVAVAAAGGEKNTQVMIHEFAHTIAGLGDEYAYDSPSSDTTSNIHTKAEPWEPNITNLIDFNKKWAALLIPNTPIPTPDSLAKKYPIGLFEGANYMTKGMFRPSYNCRMRTTEVNYFCPVCQDVINKKIKSYLK